MGMLWGPIATGHRLMAGAPSMHWHWGVSMSKRKARVPIDKLLAYWIDLSKRPTLTYEDFLSISRKAEETLEHFTEFYGWARGSDIEHAQDKFFRGLPSLIAWSHLYFKGAYKTKQIGDNEYATMKDLAEKFVPRIKKCFGHQLTLSRLKKTPLQDAEELLSISTKLSYRWAAGIIASNHIAELLIRLSNLTKGAKFKDDIITLYQNLKTKEKDSKLGRFLIKSYRRFEDADKTRNRCAHINEGDPTRQEIEQSISLGRLLQRFV
jgi:hypothetical protein